MLAWKPERMNGKVVFRGYSRDTDGVMHMNESIAFAPTLLVGRPKIEHPDHLVEMALKDLISVSDQTGDPVIKAQAMTFRKDLKKHQTAWLARAAANEREIIRQFLEAHGFNEAAEALGNG